MTDTAIAVTVDGDVINTDARLLALENEVREMRSTLDNILAQINVISEAVGPTLESLKNSPILKMMGV